MSNFAQDCIEKFLRILKFILYSAQSLRNGPHGLWMFSIALTLPSLYLFTAVSLLIRETCQDLLCQFTIKGECGNFHEDTIKAEVAFDKFASNKPHLNAAFEVWKSYRRKHLSINGILKPQILWISFCICCYKFPIIGQYHKMWVTKR